MSGAPPRGRDFRLPVTCPSAMGEGCSVATSSVGGAHLLCATGDGAPNAVGSAQPALNGAAREPADSGISDTPYPGASSRARVGRQRTRSQRCTEQRCDEGGAAAGARAGSVAPLPRQPSTRARQYGASVGAATRTIPTTSHAADQRRRTLAATRSRSVSGIEGGCRTGTRCPPGAGIAYRASRRSVARVEIALTGDGQLARRTGTRIAAAGDAKVAASAGGGRR